MSDFENFLKLNDIVEKATNKTIILPTVQRGFVWKPYQIENLWDSLLRGYPIGSFVLSKKDNSNNEYELLDGQQRASAICLGFYDPLNKNSNTNNKIFKTSNENIMIFIDLIKPNTDNDNRKYIFRVITKSHPWGYRRQENQKKLDSQNISKAMSYYNIDNSEYDYLQKPLKEFCPYDAYKPIPLGLFINAAINKENIEELESSIQEWNKNLKVNKREELQENEKSYSVKEIYNEIKKMLDKPQIPILLRNLQELITIDDESNETKNNIEESKNNKDIDDENDTNDEKSEDIEQEKNEDRNVDEIENLFIRLNSGGTPLSGEELNYSILKAKINSELQENIEKKCKGLFRPARFITIVFRLFNTTSEQKDVTEKDSISMKIKSKQFQKLMSGKRKDKFKKFLIEFLDSDVIKSTEDLGYDDKKSTKNIKNLLIYGKNNTIGLPKFVAYSLADKAPEIMFMLLYRLYIKQDVITPDLKPKVLGIITLFTWLGKGDKQKDYSKLLNNIWLCVKKFNTEKFWSSETIQRATLKYGSNEILTPFPYLKKLKKIIPDSLPINSLSKEKILNSDYGEFIKKSFFNTDIVLYAQREALSDWFYVIEDYSLEDTNRPYDWDHISPNSYSKKKIHKTLKSWYNSNGNFRAWKYSWNRGDHDNTPSIKLNPTSKDELEFWKKQLKKADLSQKQLKEIILKNSFCEKEWLNLNDNTYKKIKDNSTAKQIINCILNRNIKICLNWYEQLKINELIPKNISNKDIIALFDSFINNVKWQHEKEFGENERLRYYLPIGVNKLILFFSFFINDNTFKTNTIVFGFHNDNDDNTLINIKIPEENIERYDNVDEYYITNNFTLVSFSESSMIELFKEFYLWLKGFPDKKIRDSAINKFCNSFNIEYKNKIINI